jgi:hypothetical protein
MSEKTAVKGRATSPELATEMSGFVVKLSTGRSEADRATHVHEFLGIERVASGGGLPVDSHEVRVDCIKRCLVLPEALELRMVAIAVRAAA